MSEGFRIEKDTMGEVKVPADAYYGAQTARARDNFPISGRGIPPLVIRALGMIKAAAAKGWLEERAAVLEKLTSIRRAGADIIITYHAKDAARWLST